MIRDPDQWTGGKTPFTYMAMPAVLEFDEEPKNWKTLWPWTDRAEGEQDEVNEQGLYPKWDGPSLFTRRSEVAPSVWAMVYQQEDVQSDSIFSPTIVAGCVNGMRKRGPLKSETPGHPKNVDSLYTIIGFLHRSGVWREPFQYYRCARASDNRILRPGSKYHVLF